ncbi:hypothetical protein [Breoghania sp.]|uniref:hypothetical protein n=1 Tax=Breoghania sp. TaxID=2065378 RepID=UPI00262DB1CB|nr:hypothetical protein [Breoghania sp.]MDJ0930544.1 hypothetical protein [Breoghania sp.]
MERVVDPVDHFVRIFGIAGNEGNGVAAQAACNDLVQLADQRVAGGWGEPFDDHVFTVPPCGDHDANDLVQKIGHPLLADHPLRGAHGDR